MNISHVIDHLVLFRSRARSHAHIISIFLLKYVVVVTVFMVGCLSTVYFLLLGSSCLHTSISIGPCIIILFVYVSINHLTLALASTYDIQLPFHLCHLIVRISEPYNFLCVVQVVGVLNRWLGITNVQTIIEFM